MDDSFKVSRKKQSEVWNDFYTEEVSNDNGDGLITVVKCKHCSWAKPYNKKNGTNPMINHARNTQSCSHFLIINKNSAFIGKITSFSPSGGRIMRRESKPLSSTKLAQGMALSKIVPGVQKLCNYINAEQVDSVDSSIYGTVFSPNDGSVIAKVPFSSKNDVNLAVRNAKVAFESWSGLTIKQRAAIMFKFHYLVEENANELAELIVKENGKNMVEALAEIAKGNETVEYAASLPQLAGGRILEVSKGIHCADHRQPLGIIAAIVPFNFPAMVPMWTIPIALTMGNCVILKPSEKVPCTMLRMAELLTEAGLPPGVFQVVNGVSEVVNCMCDHPEISAVTFVGSSRVAEIVANRCNSMHKRVLALGGAKNHLIALPDCDIAMAAKDVVASFAGCCGQRCMAASVLILVDEDGDSNEEDSSDRRNDALLREIIKTTSNLSPGQSGGQVGPLIDKVSQNKVIEYITDAEATDNAQILLDGRHWATSMPQGFWCGPTIILHNSESNQSVDHIDRALREEIFGPVLSVIRVKSREDAIAIENANPYGNAACIYTEKGASAEWFTKRFRAGMLGVNVGIPVPREPFSFGGLYGTHSKFGLCDITGDGAMEFFSNRIKITTKWSSSYASQVSYNYSMEASSNEDVHESDEITSDGVHMDLTGRFRTFNEMEEDEIQESNLNQLERIIMPSSNKRMALLSGSDRKESIIQDKANFDGII